MLSAVFFRGENFALCNRNFFQPKCFKKSMRIGRHCHCLAKFISVNQAKEQKQAQKQPTNVNAEWKHKEWKVFYSVALVLLFASRLFTRSSVFPLQKGIGATFYWLDVFFVSYLKAPVYLRFLGLALLEVHCLCVRLVRFFLHLFYSFERGVNV